MLRGTTLGWALEAGGNRLWMAGWRLWLPLLLILDSALMVDLRDAWLYSDQHSPSLALGFWAGWAGEPPTWPAVVLETAPELWLPVSHLGRPSAAAVVVGVWILVGWWRERRSPRSAARCTFSRTALAPFLAGLCVVVPALQAVGERSLFNASRAGSGTATLSAVALALELVASAASAALVIWLPLRLSPSRLGPVMIVSAALTASAQGRIALASQFAIYGNAEAQLVSLGVAIVLWMAIPVAFGFALKRPTAAGLSRNWLRIASLVLAGLGMHLALALPVMAMNGAVGLEWHEWPAATYTVWIVPLAWNVGIEAVALLGSLWLAGAIGALGGLGQLGEDAAPVDAVAAQQQS